MANIVQGLTKFIHKFIEVAAQGGEALVKFIKHLFEQVFKKADDANPDNLRYIPDETTQGKKRYNRQKEVEKQKTQSKLKEENDEELFRKILTGQGGGKRYKRTALRLIAREIEKRFIDIGLKVEIVTQKSHPERYKRWRSYPNDILGSCKTNEKPPKMFLRDDATELTIQHEIWHIDDFKRFGFESFNKTPNWKLEELVWDRIWKQRHRWTKQEILDSYKYYIWSCLKQNVTHNNIKELDKLLKTK